MTNKCHSIPKGSSSHSVASWWKLPLSHWRMSLSLTSSPSPSMLLWFFPSARILLLFQCSSLWNCDFILKGGTKTVVDLPVAKHLVLSFLEAETLWVGRSEAVGWLGGFSRAQCPGCPRDSRPWVGAVKWGLWASSLSLLELHWGEST